MPFIAKRASTSERIDITQIKQPRLELAFGDIVCQSCEAPMIIKAGTIIRPHFAHKPKPEHCLYNSESVIHREAKILIAKHIRQQTVGYQNTRVEIEWIIPGVNRIADVALIFPTGWIIAHEIQLSRISLAELEQRTSDYQAANVDIVWWLGRDAITLNNRNWCIETFGTYNFIDTKVLDKVISG